MKNVFNNKIYLIGGIIILAILLLYFYSPARFYNLLYGIIPFAFLLVCPLSMVIMMKMMMGDKKNDSNTIQQQNLLYTCPVCKLSYTDKQWAMKCEAWCKEHNSCNLEITSHAVK